MCYDENTGLNKLVLITHKLSQHVRQSSESVKKFLSNEIKSNKVVMTFRITFLETNLDKFQVKQKLNASFRYYFNINIL